MSKMASIFHKAPSRNKSFFLVKMYDNLLKLEEDIARSHEMSSFKLNFTLLAKLTSEQLKEEGFVMELKNKIDDKANTGHFNNPNIGMVFCAGPLSNMFLQTINGKALGAMPVGIYGILRGLDVEKEIANNCIKKLSEGNFMLIISGDPQDIIKLLPKKNETNRY